MRKFKFMMLALLLSGCAGVSAEPVRPGDISQAGFHYFMPAAYLLVASAGAEPKIVYLPDKSREMKVTESPGLFGTVSMALTFEDGWKLTQVAGSGDQKTSEMLSALSSFVPSLLPAAAGAPMGIAPRRMASSEPLPPGLYRLVYDDASGMLTGLCAVFYFAPDGNVGGDCK